MRINVNHLEKKGATGRFLRQFKDSIDGQFFFFLFNACN